MKEYIQPKTEWIAIDYDGYIAAGSAGEDEETENFHAKSVLSDWEEWDDDDDVDSWGSDSWNR